MQVELVADIPVSIKILKRGSSYGYELTLGLQTFSGWSTLEGGTLHSPLHAWRRALKRCKNQSLPAPGLVVNRVV